jgi:hypothetical protein
MLMGSPIQVATSRTGKVGDNRNEEGVPGGKGPGANGSGDGISRIIETINYAEADCQNDNDDKQAEGRIRHA